VAAQRNCAGCFLERPAEARWQADKALAAFEIGGGSIA